MTDIGDSKGKVNSEVVLSTFTTQVSVCCDGAEVGPAVGKDNGCREGREVGKLKGCLVGTVKGW